MSTDTKGHNPTWLDKWLLVRYKKFPDMSQVPETVSAIMMRRVHDRARVHACFIMMALSGLGMFTNAMIGKYYSKQGYSLEKAREEYQREYNERKNREEREKLAAAAAAAGHK